MHIKEYTSNRSRVYSEYIKNTFRIGDIVGIDHKKISSSENFRIYKINNKNIKVQSLRDNSEYTVSPGLLVKR